MTAAPVYVCPDCGAEDDDEAVIERHMKRHPQPATPGPLPRDTMVADRSELPPHHPPEWAASPEETAYEAFTARRGTQRIAWEALDPSERADWHAVVRALAKRSTR